MNRLASVLALALCLPVGNVTEAAVLEADVCIYGGTAAGVAAAVQSTRMGKSAILIEPGQHLGGLSSGGLGATDIGNKAAIGGIAREFYRQVAQHYAQDSAWTLESREEYFTRKRSGQAAASDLTSADATMWTFEPSVAERLLRAMAHKAQVPVHYGKPLAAVQKAGSRITEIRLTDGSVCRAQMFIDATYEGDLMAKAKVSYHVGREANAQYGETLNGVRATTPHHQFTVAVDPYSKPGDPSSGLLPFIQPGDGGKPGSGDRCVQAYNFRLCFTTNAVNRRAVEPPPDYDPAQYELLARYLEALVASGQKPKLGQFWNPIWMPNGKTDINNNGGFSTDFIGANYDYPEADYATRQRIWKAHENYIRGFITFLATSPRVPADMRAEMQRWGMAKDEFPDTGGWPNQLYVREARRMISDYVMTEHNCRGTVQAEDSVGLGAYNMDSHNCQRLVKQGRVENEGDVQVGVRPYPIAYRSIIPKVGECDNLLVPVCLSSSHIAYGSIRMEPVFMILAQSAATAAALALEAKVPVQRVDYTQLRTRLLADRQVLHWTAAAPSAGLPRLEGIVLDDSEGQRTGAWVPSSAVQWRRVGTGYIHDNNAHKGQVTIEYAPDLPGSGEYEVILISPPHPNRATNVPVTIIAQQGETRVTVDQRRGDGFARLGRFQFPKGKTTRLRLSNAGTDGYVVADGVQFVRKN